MSGEGCGDREDGGRGALVGNRRCLRRGIALTSHRYGVGMRAFMDRSAGRVFACRYTRGMNTVDRLLQEALRLPEKQRLALAHQLLSSVEVQPDGRIEREWKSVVRERIRRYDREESGSRPADEVVSELRRKLKK